MKQMMVKRWFLVVCWAILGLSSEYTHADEALCVNGVPETSNSELFDSDDSGDILHIPTGLVFMRCAIGQTWNSTSCIGDATALTWQEALQLSVGYDYNDSQNWRLPNIKELSAITERACISPSINTASFPQTPSTDFWTSTPSVLDEQRAWVVGFFNGTSSLKAKDRSIFVRLVRTKLPNELPR
jgi:hypothetical protein